MISLLERFYDLTSGTVVFDGVEFTGIHLGQYRRDIAMCLGQGLYRVV